MFSNDELKALNFHNETMKGAKTFNFTEKQISGIVNNLDKLLLTKERRIKLLSIEFYKELDREYLQIWAHKRARYLIPTIELVNWLKEKIGDRKAIEIGSGNSDLSYYLGIQGTDSCIQQDDEDVRAYIALYNQPGTCPREDILKLEALEAIELLKPDVVIGAWITQYGNPLEQGQGRNLYGVKENDLINQCEYIFLGNKVVHKAKDILSIEHEEYGLETGIYSRAIRPDGDVIWIWKKQGV